MSKFSVFFSMLFLLISLFIFWIFSSSFETIYEPSFKARFSSLYFIPEGWGFFTKNPREGILDVYNINKDGKLSLFICPNGSLKYILGANRLARRIGMETSMVLNHINENAWKSFETTSFLDSITHINEIKIERKSIENIYYINKGSYLFVYYEPIPWSYFKHPERFRRKWAIIKVTII